MDRREAVKRISTLLGVAISGPTMAGMLAGCQAAETVQTLTATQHELLAVMTEHIIPQTDTPGARDARVADYIDSMLTHFYPEDRRQKFLDDMKAVDVMTKEQYGQSFINCSDEEQFHVLDALDAAAFPDRASMTKDEQEAFRQQRAAEGRPFIMTLKELTLAGYYTSEVGATQELRINPMVPYRGDIPFSEVGRAWA